MPAPKHQLDIGVMSYWPTLALHIKPQRIVDAVSKATRAALGVIVDVLTPNQCEDLLLQMNDRPVHGSLDTLTALLLHRRLGQGGERRYPSPQQILDEIDRLYRH